MKDEEKTKEELINEIKKLRRRNNKLKKLNSLYRESEDVMEKGDLFRTAIEASKDAMVAISEEGVITIFNPAAEEIFGHTKEEVINQSLDLLIPADYKELHKKHVTNYFSAGSPSRAIGKTLELPALHSDGTIFPIELSLSTGYIKKKQFVLAVIRDIKERKKAEEELRKSKEFLNNIINALDDPIFVKDEQHRWVLLNDSFISLMEYTKEELIGKTDHEIFPKEQADIFWEKDNLVFKTGKTNINEEKITWQGKVHTIVTKKSVFTDSVTGKKFIAGLIRDITDLRQAEEESNRLEIAIEHAAESVAITDKNAIIQYVNPAFERITGYSKKEILGEKLRILEEGPDNRVFYKDMWETIKRGDVWTGNFLNRKKDGAFYEVEASISPVKDSKNNITNYVAVKRDITQEVKLERQLRQSQKMEALGTLAGGIAHDFNNILMLILGYTALVMKDIPEGTVTYRNLKQIVKAGNRAKDLVKQILAFSRKSEQERKAININPLLKEGLKLIRSSLPSTIKIKRNIKVKSAVVMADPIQVHQVLMNLCTNALQAMREKGGGVLEVALSEVEINQENSNLYQSLEPGSYIKLTVRDTGPGIDERIMERIFEPYFTTKKPEEGTGLGLAVVHGIVKSHGGEITVTSEMGKGTDFHVYLPALKSDIPLETKETIEIPRGKEKILFVDDEKDMVDMGIQLLKSMGYEVTGRSNVFDALEIFRKNPDNFDLVITDQTMPHMTGSELARVLISIRADIPVILCSGFSEIISEEKARAIGIKEFIMKPIDIRKIATTIREIVDKKDYS